jgi:hypothetical protein
VLASRARQAERRGVHVDLERKEVRSPDRNDLELDLRSIGSVAREHGGTGVVGGALNRRLYAGCQRTIRKERIKQSPSGVVGVLVRSLGVRRNGRLDRCDHARHDSGEQTDLHELLDELEHVARLRGDASRRTSR